MGRSFKLVLNMNETPHGLITLGKKYPNVKYPGVWYPRVKNPRLILPRFELL